MKLFEIYAELGLETGKFVAGINGAGKTAKAFASSLGSSVSATTVMMGNLMSGAVQKGAQYVKEFAGIGLEYNNTMETYVTNFKTMLGGSSEAAQKLTSDLETMAAKTPFAMSDLADATQTLLSFGQDSGTVLDTLQSLGDIAMGDAGKLSSLTLAFAQASSSGKLMGQDLMQMINAGFNPLQSIIDRTGASMGDLKDFMSNGKASADLKKQMKAAQKEVNQLGNAASDGAKLLAQMAKDGVISAETLGMIFEMETSPGGRYYNAMQAASETFSGMLSTLQDDSAALLGKVFKPMTNWLKEEMIPRASQFIANVNKGFDVGGIEGAWSAAKGTIVGYLTEMGDAAYETGTNFLGKILTGLTGDTVTGEEIRGVIGGVFGAGGTAIKDVLSAASTFFSDLDEKLGDPDASIGEKIAGVFTAGFTALNSLLTASGTFMLDLYAAITGDTTKAQDIKDFFSKLGTDAVDAFNAANTTAGDFLNGFYSALTADEGGNRQNIITYFEGLWADVGKTATSAKSAAADLLSELYEFLSGKEATAENVGGTAGTLVKGVGTFVSGAANATSDVTGALANWIDGIQEGDADKRKEAGVQQLTGIATAATALMQLGVDVIDAFRGEGATEAWMAEASGFNEARREKAAQLGITVEELDRMGLSVSSGSGGPQLGYTQDPGILEGWQKAQEQNAEVIKSQADLISMIGNMWGDASMLGLTESQLDDWLNIISSGKKDDEYFSVAQAVMEAFRQYKDDDDSEQAPAVPSVTVNVTLNGEEIGASIEEQVTDGVTGRIMRQIKQAKLVTA